MASTPFDKSTDKSVESGVEGRFRAGSKLRALREARGWNQRDVERETASLFGDDRRVRAPQVSRLETGEIAEPGIAIVTRYGALLHVEPNTLMGPDYYDLLPPGMVEPSLDRRMTEAAAIADQLPVQQRELFYQLVRVAALTAQADAHAARARDGNNTADLVSGNTIVEVKQPRGRGRNR